MILKKNQKRSSKYQRVKKIFFSLLLVALYSVGCKSAEPTVVVATNHFEKVDSLKMGFQNLSEDNTVWCYWYWIGDDISKQGITKDLEAMKKAGIGGALIGNINPDEIDGKVPILSEEWWDHMVHAVNEGKRIGVDIGAFNCPGWSQSGGPWIKSDMAMRHLVYSETKARGGQKIVLDLPKPRKEFQDIYVLAFPSISSENHFINSANSSVESRPNIIHKEYLFDKDTTTDVGFLSTIQKYEIIFKTEQTITARSLKIIPGKKPIQIKVNVSAFDGVTWYKVKEFRINRSKLDPNVGPDKYAPILVALPETKADQFKIEFEIPETIFKSFTEKDPQFQTWDVSEIIISEAAGLDSYAEKNLSKMHPTPFPAWNSYLWETQDSLADKSLVINSSDLLDISEFMDENGRLVWDAPEGNWTIQRFGMTPTGTTNAPSAPQGKGYEVDKANEELVRFHYENYIGEFLKRIPEKSKSAFKYVIADSYEMGSQNWTDDFETKFEKEYGYNPKKYFPVFSGRIVESAEKSDRFLWDLRRLMADAVAYDYVGGLRKRSNEDNLELWLENYGHWGFPSEFLMYGGQSNIVSGEFWNEGSLGDIECKSASSAAHIYGKNRVSAEAFTAAHRTYVRHPAMLKKRGDWAFTEGINHVVLHLYIHQPDEDRVPGVNAWFSTEFNRHNIWFEKSKAYFDYLRRCQFLLQQGNYTADVCYFIGENAPIMTGVRQPELPKGYSYDYINAEVIMERLEVRGGRLVLPDGMGYDLMVLPPFETMRPEVMAKIERLVEQGAKIYGKPPLKSPSLENFPKSDEMVKSMANRMWSGKNGLKPYGKGFIVDGMTLGDALDQLNIKRDIILHENDPVLWTHRRLSHHDIYFLTNQSESQIQIKPSFRIANKTPELWDAITGEVKAIRNYNVKDGRIEIPIVMEGLQSWFVVFKEPSQSNPTMQLGMESDFPVLSTIKTLNDPWQVNFENREYGPEETIDFPKLTDWIDHENIKIKYYSGTAVYNSTFNYSKNQINTPLYLDLGKVGVMASVKLNDVVVGTTWIAPHRFEVSKVIKSGQNKLEIEVVNVWRNRITGDKLMPEKEPNTWLLLDSVDADESLVPSGLIGPVTLKQEYK